MPRLSWLSLVLLLAAVTTAEARRVPRAPRAPRAPAYGQAQLRGLFEHALSAKSTLRSVLTRIDRALRRDPQAAFVREPIDEQHPALSTPWDLPKGEYPNRAVVRRDIRVFGVPGELRVVAPLAALDRDRGKALLDERAATLVLMVTAKNPARPLPTRKATQLLARLGLSVFASGGLGVCAAGTAYCYLRRYVFLPRKGRRRGTLLVELAKPDGAMGGLKLITVPR